MPPEQTITASPAQTRALAAALAGRLRAGDVLLFRGGLGAGKTTFVQGLAEGLGSPAAVTSPTFALLCEYKGARTLAHLDAWRMNGGFEELEATGVFDLLSRGAILAVEWSENLPGCFVGEEVWSVTLEPLSEHERRITILPPPSREGGALL